VVNLFPNTLEATSRTGTLPPVPERLKWVRAEGFERASDELQQMSKKPAAFEYRKQFHLIILSLLHWSLYLRQTCTVPGDPVLLRMLSCAAMDPCTGSVA
jgi:hypothetical protein